MNESIKIIAAFALLSFNQLMASEDGPCVGFKRQRALSLGEEPIYIVQPLKRKIEITEMDILSCTPTNPFFLKFNPANNPQGTARELVKLGVSIDSLFENVLEIYKSYLIDLIKCEAKNPDDYSDEIEEVQLFFTNIYNGTIKCFVEIAEREA